MRRWNGWGDDGTTYPLLDSAARYLTELVGDGPHFEDASLEQAIAAVPSSPLSPHPLVSTDPEERLRHARGQSLPDWIALRSGRIGTFPGGVAYPTSDEEVRAMLEYARNVGAKVIPYGGGTSVVGHINPLPGEAKVCGEVAPALRLRLVGRYGDEVCNLVEAAQSGELDPIGSTSTLWAELRWAARAEGVVHLDDLLLRRVRLGIIMSGGGLKEMARICAIVQPELGWDEERWKQEGEAYRQTWQQYYNICDKPSMKI